MGELRIALLRLIRRFGRPDQSVRIEIHREDFDDADEQLANQARNLREIEARLKILEAAADPRGLRRRG